MKLIRIIIAAMIGLVPLGANAGTPVVVELYTSQGCSSCPPADAHLAQLAARDDVIALSMHVTYWDYIGWRDTLARKANDARQRRYQHLMGTRRIYTPQMVVNGHLQAAGTDHAAIAELITQARSTTAATTAVTLTPTDMGVKVSIANNDAVQGRATVQVVWFDPAKKVPIARGENAGRTLQYANVSRDLAAIGRYDGAALTLMIPPMEGVSHCAVIVQDDATGRILGAAKIGL